MPGENEIVRGARVRWRALGHAACTLVSTVFVALFIASGLVGCGAISSSEDVPAMDDQHDGRSETSNLVLWLGTNEPGSTDAGSFEPLGDGSELPIVFGQQGLWMVVLALQVDGMEGDYADVSGNVTVADTVVGSLSIQHQRFKQSESGQRYLLNFFLVLDEPAQGGKEARISMAMTPEGGEAQDLVRKVRLVGGPGS